MPRADSHADPGDTTVDHLAIADAELQEWFEVGDAPYARSRAEGKNAFLHVLVEPGSSLVVSGSDQDDDSRDPTIGLIDPGPDDVDGDATPRPGSPDADAGRGIAAGRPGAEGGRTG